MKSLRACTSAGEALPEGVGRRWKERLGVDILDGIGSTEMLHIFLSNRAGDVQYGTSGTPVPGYRVRLVDEGGDEIIAAEEPGELQISGPSSAVHYWNQPEKSRATFLEGWTRSARKYQAEVPSASDTCRKASRPWSGFGWVRARPDPPQKPR